MKAKDNPTLKAIREQGERERAAKAWRAKLGLMHENDACDCGKKPEGSR